MGIKTIPHSECARLLPHDPAIESWMVEQVEWFSDSSGSLLGTIAKGKGAAGWQLRRLGTRQVRRFLRPQGDEQL